MTQNFKVSCGLYRTVAGAFYLASLTAAGCSSAPPVLRQPPAQLPTYQTLAARYNKNLVGVERLWARAVVELKWRDPKGTHYEQGDGNLLIVLPHRAALSLGKLGHTVMWAGCDDRHYWLFDLRQDHELFVGQHAARLAWAEHQLPIPIQPRQLSSLLGLTPLPPVTADSQPAVTWDNGHFLIELPYQRQRVWIDPVTARPTRIDLTDDQAQNRARCDLSRWEPMTLDGIPPGGYPWIATRLEVSLVGQEGTMTLYLSDPTDGKAQNRIRDKAFELDHLIKVFKPVKLVDLDTQGTQE